MENCRTEPLTATPEYLSVPRLAESVALNVKSETQGFSNVIVSASVAVATDEKSLRG